MRTDSFHFEMATNSTSVKLAQPYQTFDEMLRPMIRIWAQRVLLVKHVSKEDREPTVYLSLRAAKSSFIDTNSAQNWSRQVSYSSVHLDVSSSISSQKLSRPY